MKCKRVMRLMLRLQGFVALNVVVPVFASSRPLILIKNYPLVANRHVRAVQSWIFAMPQGIDQMQCASRAFWQTENSEIWQGALLGQ